MSAIAAAYIDLIGQEDSFLIASASISAELPSIVS